jgi:cyclase
MVAKRIIPCLDIDNNRTVKGVNFLNLVDAGDPVELAKVYSSEGADELVFLDITATKDKRKTLAKLAEKISENINIPFTVGGGIKSLDDASSLLRNGADKISINTQAFKTPNLINEISLKYGNQCVVVAIDAKFIDDAWYV